MCAKCGKLLKTKKDLWEHEVKNHNCKTCELKDVFELARLIVFGVKKLWLTKDDLRKHMRKAHGR